MAIERIYLFLLILLTGTVYAALFSNVILAFSIIVLIGLFLKDKNTTTYKVTLLGTYISISALLLIVLLIHFFLVPLANDPLPYIALYFRFITVGLFYVYIKNKNIDIASVLQKILKVIGIHAVISFVLSFFVINYVFTINTDVFYTNTFGYIFFYNSSFDLLGLTFYRNQGIFWEPGILQIYMNLLFFISSFIISNRKLQILSAFLIFTTYSTTGIGILLLQATAILFSEKITLVQKILVSLMFFIIALPFFALNYTSKFNDQTTSSDVTSSILRVYDFMEGVKMVQKYPLTGIGMSQQTYMAIKYANNDLISNYSDEFIDVISERRSSNSVMYFLTRFGIPFCLLWFMMIWKQPFFGKKWLFFAIILISNLSEPLLLEPFFLFFVASAVYGSIKIRLNLSLKHDLC